MLFDRSQLMRGTLEGCILHIISKEMTYGYEIIVSLRQHGFREMSEGTIYPLLLRLEKQGNISSKLLPSPLGPKRKYYSITPEGTAYLESFVGCWREITGAVGSVFAEPDNPITEEGLTDG